MNQSDLEKLNDKISLEEGKIFFKSGRFFTSKLLERLKMCGWKVEKLKFSYKIYDSDNRLVVNELTVFSGLLELSIIIRKRSLVEWIQTNG